jgi:hypothetical protein
MELDSAEWDIKGFDLSWIATFLTIERLNRASSAKAEPTQSLSQAKDTATY